MLHCAGVDRPGPVREPAGGAGEGEVVAGTSFAGGRPGSAIGQNRRRRGCSTVGRGGGRGSWGGGGGEEGLAGERRRGRGGGDSEQVGELWEGMEVEVVRVAGRGAILLQDSWPGQDFDGGVWGQGGGAGDWGGLH